LIILRLSVTVDNHAAIRCYERCGFVRYGTEPLSVLWQGQLYDEALMALRLIDT
jgi:RimJ/RimL family protein N-acetyltransferase